MFVLSFLVGLVMLLGGAELLVRGGGRLALALRVPVIVVALTVVAYGTSMPEILVSATAAVRGSSDIALGNVVGSNIANIALVLGLASVVTPVAVGRELMRREIPALVLLHLAMPLMMFDGDVSRVDGLILVGIGFVYNLVLLRDALAGRRELDDDETPTPGGDALMHAALLAGGLALLVGGAQFFVEGAVTMARLFGIEERIIGLTVVALGTSAPEVVTAMVSAWRDENDMAVGNSLGSNIVNVSFALGLTAAIHPIVVRGGGTFQDLAVALVLTLLLVPMILRGRRISRPEGALLASSYVAYLVLVPTLGGS